MRRRAVEAAPVVALAEREPVLVGAGGGASLPPRRPPSSAGRSADDIAAATASDLRISRISYRDGVTIGLLQVLALLPGISRSGVTMVGGLWRGLDHEDAARFAFLLATPVILAAGVLKLPSLFGPAGDDIRGQVLVGSLLCGVTAYFTVRFLVRYFETRTLTPFAVYCLIAGAASLIRFTVFA